MGFHEYNPMYAKKWRQYKSGTRRRHIKSQFSCAHCGRKTKWLNKKETEALLESGKCRWGI